ncbi:MAG: S8 family serine peptidase, partial [Cytophagales bacterium]|nr:S8 family serine peptidase [Cytophagales bacterium]
SLLHSFSENIVKNINSFWIVNIISCEVKADVLLQLADNNAISKMDLDGKLIFDVATKEENIISKTPGAAEPGLRVINANRLWKLGYTGAGRIVMNIDTGVDGLHSALGWRWRGHHVPDSLAWFDPVNHTNFPTDPSDHGTATMGIVCGLDSSTHDTIGVAFGAEWIASNSLWGNPHTSYTIAAFQWAMDPDGNPTTTNDMPDVINNSWWDPAVGFCDPIYTMTFNAVEAVGIAIIFSAGAAGPSSSSILTPANINTNAV